MPYNNESSDYGENIASLREATLDHASIAGTVLGSLASAETVSQSLRELWGRFESQYTELCQDLQEVGWYAVPLDKTGRRIEDLSRKQVFVSGATVALHTLEEMCNQHGLDPASFFDAWKNGTGVRLLDTNDIPDANMADKYRAQTKSISGYGSKFLHGMNYEYQLMLETIEASYPQLENNGDMFRSAFGYVLREASHALATFAAQAETRRQDDDFNRLTSGGNWDTHFMERCYETQPGDDIDVTIEFSRIQRIFERYVPIQSHITPESMIQADEAIHRELIEDDSLIRANIPHGSDMRIKNANHVITYPIEMLHSGPEIEGTLFESSDGETLRGKYSFMFSLIRRPSGKVTAAEWVDSQVHEFGPAIVMTDVVGVDEDDNVVSSYDGRVVLIALDHVDLQAQYRVAKED